MSPQLDPIHTPSKLAVHDFVDPDLGLVILQQLVESRDDENWRVVVDLNDREQLLVRAILPEGRRSAVVLSIG